MGATGSIDPTRSNLNDAPVMTRRHCDDAATLEPFDSQDSDPTHLAHLNRRQSAAVTAYRSVNQRRNMSAFSAFISVARMPVERELPRCFPPKSLANSVSL